jgi:hypothetical protein
MQWCEALAERATVDTYADAGVVEAADGHARTPPRARVRWHVAGVSAPPASPAHGAMDTDAKPSAAAPFSGLYGACGAYGAYLALIAPNTWEGVFEDAQEAASVMARV